MEYKVRLNHNGRIVIPALCRKQLHFIPGEELILRVEGNTVSIMSLEQSIKNAQSLVQKYTNKQSVLTKLSELRREDP